jgi:hypothetical protein
MASLSRLFKRAITIGIRKEDPSRIWERRAPLTPEAVRHLVRERNVQVHVEPCDRRVFSNEQYEKVGTTRSNTRLLYLSPTFPYAQIPNRLVLSFAPTSMTPTLSSGSRSQLWTPSSSLLLPAMFLGRTSCSLIPQRVKPIISLYSPPFLISDNIPLALSCRP